jgi:hypothetical protein
MRPLLPPTSENVLCGFGKWARYWGGGPDTGPVPGRSLPGAGCGDGLAVKESFMGPTRPGSILPDALPPVGVLRGRVGSAYLAVLGVQVREAGTGGDIDKDLGALSSGGGSRALRPSDQV